VRLARTHTRKSSPSTQAAARAIAPGVLAVFTGDDLKGRTASTGWPCGWGIKGQRTGNRLKEPPHPAHGRRKKVRYVGDCRRPSLVAEKRAPGRAKRSRGGVAVDYHVAAGRSIGPHGMRSSRKPRLYTMMCPQQSVLRLGTSATRPPTRRRLQKAAAHIRPAHQARKTTAWWAIRMEPRAADCRISSRKTGPLHAVVPTSQFPARGAAAHGPVRAQYPAAEAAGDSTRRRRRLRREAVSITPRRPVVTWGLAGRFRQADQVGVRAAAKDLSRTPHGP